MDRRDTEKVEKGSETFIRKEHSQWVIAPATKPLRLSGLWKVVFSFKRHH